jgi:hypothetical protein
MKKILFILIISGSIITGSALQLGIFSGWNKLVEDSSDIMIVSILQCSYSPNGVGDSDATVISVLKGNVKPGPLLVRSTFFPYQGECLLIFANHEGNQTGQVYDAYEGFRVVPLNRSFRTNELAGKLLNEQIQFILNSRLKDLDEELARDNEEKIRLGTAMSNNVPQVISKPPSTGVKSF